jgi:ubiquinone/menaquinone biosynthesis C-methylase UbiE
MREDWDQRARENSRYYIANARRDWSAEEFYQSGETTVRQDILTDMENICQGREPKQMSVLEIGCGAGRVTRALAQVFGEVYGVDVSGEMVRQAREALCEFPNAHVIQNNGADLKALGGKQFDFAYSTAVFHHIGRRELIERYVREVNRLLRPGCLFKFEVQGCVAMEHDPEGTWLGVPFTARQAVEMAVRCGFDPRFRSCEGEERFWLWYFKWP